MSLPGNIGLLSRMPTPASSQYGNVDGPASATDNAVVRFDGTTGKLIKNSVLIIANTTGALSGFTTGAGITWHGGGTITGASGSLDLTASGTNQNITLTPSGSGQVRLAGHLLVGGLTTDGTGVLQMTGTGNTNGVTINTLNLYSQDTNTFAFRSQGSSVSNNLYTSGGTLRGYWQFDGTNCVLASVSGNLILSPNNTTALTLDTSQNATFAKKITSYNGITTAGQGVPVVVASGRVTAQSAANASISTYTVGAADGSFEISANMNVTAATSLATTLTCTYTDESNTARTMILPITQLSGSFIALGAITGTGAWESPAMHIRCKAATAITILTSAGTFTGVTYTAEGIIKQTS